MSNKKLILTAAGIYMVGWVFVLILQALLPYRASALFGGLLVLACLGLGALTAVSSARAGTALPRDARQLLCGLGGAAVVAGLSWAFCMTGNRAYGAFEGWLNHGVSGLLGMPLPHPLTLAGAFPQVCALLTPLSFYGFLFAMRPDGKWAAVPTARGRDRQS